MSGSAISRDGPGCCGSTTASSGCARSTTSRTATPPRSCTSTTCSGPPQLRVVVDPREQRRPDRRPGLLTAEHRRSSNPSRPRCRARPVARAADDAGTTQQQPSHPGAEPMRRPATTRRLPRSNVHERRANPSRRWTHAAIVNYSGGSPVDADAGEAKSSSAPSHTPRNIHHLSGLETRQTRPFAVLGRRRQPCGSDAPDSRGYCRGPRTAAVRGLVALLSG